MTSTNDPPQGDAPHGTQHDGDPLFEALVYGWTCSDAEFNSETVQADEVRGRLAGYFEQYLQQWQPDVGDRVMWSSSIGWLHGEVAEIDYDATVVRWDLMPIAKRDGSGEKAHTSRFATPLVSSELVPEPRPVTGR